jgi:hypothetical protein
MAGMDFPGEGSGVPAAEARYARWAIAGVVGLGFALGLLFYILPRPVALHLLDELGPMERVQLGVYTLDILFLLYLFPRRPALMSWSLAGVALLAVFEINPGNLFSKLVEAPPAVPGDPAGVHLWGILALSLVAFGILAGLVHSVRGSFWAGFRAGVPEMRVAAMGFWFQVIAFFIDRIQAKYFNWHAGYRLEKGIFYFSDVVEETMEFLMPFFFFFAILLWARLRKAPPGKASA